MHHSAGSSSVSAPPSLCIRTCSFVLPRGSLCLGAAVRGRSCCRHHLRTRVRLRKMARARRATPVLGSVALSHPAGIRQAEVELSVSLAAGRIDPASGRMLLCVLGMVRGLDRAIERQKRRQSRPAVGFVPLFKPNQINHVPVNSSNPRTYLTKDSQVLENNEGMGGGVPTLPESD